MLKFVYLARNTEAMITAIVKKIELERGIGYTEGVIDDIYT